MKKMCKLVTFNLEIITIMLHPFTLRNLAISLDRCWNNNNKSSQLEMARATALKCSRQIFLSAVLLIISLLRTSISSNQRGGSGVCRNGNSLLENARRPRISNQLSGSNAPSDQALIFSHQPLCTARLYRMALDNSIIGRWQLSLPNEQEYSFTACLSLPPPT